ncbi:MAG: hypothetical protein M3083_04460 [Actinomycetota bacterium]|nr:hypothetical protein [Actinomycetota bacterium]
MSEDTLAVAALVERLRTSVAKRRESGQYPEDLEAQLEAHFQRILASRTQMPRLATLRRRIEAVRRSTRFSPDRIPTGTRLPGGSALHKGMSRLFLRQAHGILLQVQEFADRTLEALEAVAALADSADNHQHADLIELVDALTEAVAAPPVLGPAPQDSLEDHARRLERLEQAEAARRWRPWFGRDRFDQVFDQGRQLRLGQAAATALDHRTPTVAISPCEELDPMAALLAWADSSLGGIVALRADELLTAQQIVDLVVIAFERLAPDGRLLVSCGKPCGAEHADGAARPRFNPTLGPSLPARYVAFICQEAGFSAVELQELSDEDDLVLATR